VYGALSREDAPEQHDFAICTGLEHLQIGGWSIVILLASALLAGLAWLSNDECSLADVPYTVSSMRLPSGSSTTLS